MTWLLSFLRISFFFVLILHHVTGLATVIYGPQCREVQLLVSKIACKKGIETSCICPSADVDGSYRLLYGKDYDIEAAKQNLKLNKTKKKKNYEDDDLDTNSNCLIPKFISNGDEIKHALENANSIILTGYDTPINESYLNTLLENTSPSKLTKLILLTKIGVTAAKGGGGGFFGGGRKGTSKVLESENMIRQIAKAKNLDLSIIRAGILKGGGLGDNNNEYGLSKEYYNTILDIVDYTMTQGHDTFTLGINDDSGSAITPGDTIEIPNIIQQLGTKSSFDPRPYDTNRVVLASSMVATLLLYNQGNLPSNQLEFSVSTAAGKQLPSLEEWCNTFSEFS